MSFAVKSSTRAFGSDFCITHLEKAARELLQAKRPATAVRLLAMGMYNKAPVSSALLFDLLEAMLGAGIEDWRTLETYHVQRMIKRLQADEQADGSRLARLELGFLHILGPQTVRAETLERTLSRDPKLFSLQSGRESRE